MADVVRIVNANIGICTFDFDNRQVILKREGILAATMQLESMTISFSDISDVEFRPGKLMKLPAFCFVVKGNRIMTPANINATQMPIVKADSNKALDALKRLIKECHLSGIKDYERASVPKVIYGGEYQQQSREYRMRCNTCGNIFCYTDEDIMKNQKLLQQAKAERKMAVTSALGTTIIESNQHTAAADRYESQIMDFSKCPKCHSSSLTELTEEEFTEAQKTMNQSPVTAPVSSPVDEIKKYKELLDIGAITQEEFDAKKKQLLGL